MIFEFQIFHFHYLQELPNTNLLLIQHNKNWLNLFTHFVGLCQDFVVCLVTTGGGGGGLVVNLRLSKFVRLK